MYNIYKSIKGGDIMNKILSKEFLKAHREQIIKAAAVLIILTVAFFVFTGKGDSGEEPQVQASDETATHVQCSKGEIQ